MRMWMINPKMLCNKHLVGEHGEIHKHRHIFEKKQRIDGRMSPIVQIEPSSMRVRHDQLAEEMQCRGMNHNSPYTQPDIYYLPAEYLSARVDLETSLFDLMDRCPDCLAYIKNYFKKLVY